MVQNIVRLGKISLKTVTEMLKSALRILKDLNLPDASKRRKFSRYARGDLEEQKWLENRGGGAKILFSKLIYTPESSSWDFGYFTLRIHLCGRSLSSLESRFDLFWFSWVQDSHVRLWGTYVEKCTLSTHITKSSGRFSKIVVIILALFSSPVRLHHHLRGRLSSGSLLRTPQQLDGNQVGYQLDLL